MSLSPYQFFSHFPLVLSCDFPSSSVSSFVLFVYYLFYKFVCLCFNLQLYNVHTVHTLHTVHTVLYFAQLLSLPYIPVSKSQTSSSCLSPPPLVSYHFSLTLTSSPCLLHPLFVSYILSQFSYLLTRSVT